MNNQNVLFSVGIAVIMFGIGLTISFGSFRHLYTHPKPILIGLIGQILLLPTIAFLVAWFWPMKDIYKVGLVLLAACPGGTASNLVTHMLKGRVALSVSLTACNSFLILFTIPIAINLAANTFLSQKYDVPLPFIETVQKIGLTVLLPVILGMVVQELMPKMASKLEKPLQYILPAILLSMVLLVILSSSSSGRPHSLLTQDDLLILAPCLFLNVITILVGFFISMRADISHQGSYTIGIEMGLQNSALAIYIAGSLIGSVEMANVAILYSSFSFFTTLGLAYLLKRTKT